MYAISLTSNLSRAFTSYPPPPSPPSVNRSECMCINAPPFTLRLAISPRRFFASYVYEFCRITGGRRGRGGGMKRETGTMALRPVIAVPALSNFPMSLAHLTPFLFFSIEQPPPPHGKWTEGEAESIHGENSPERRSRKFGAKMRFRVFRDCPGPCIAIARLRRR